MRPEWESNEIPNSPLFPSQPSDRTLEAPAKTKPINQPILKHLERHEAFKTMCFLSTPGRLIC